MSGFSGETKGVPDPGGPDTVLRIRKGDGTTVELDFKCPGLSAQRSRFLGTREFSDPLQVKN